MNKEAAEKRLSDISGAIKFAEERQKKIKEDSDQVFLHIAMLQGRMLECQHVLSECFKAEVESAPPAPVEPAPKVTECHALGTLESEMTERHADADPSEKVTECHTSGQIQEHDK